jgi:hypothetical protein
MEKIRELLKLKITSSVLLKLSSTDENDAANKFFDQMLFSLVHSSSGPKQVGKTPSSDSLTSTFTPLCFALKLDAIYTKLLNEYRSRVPTKLPNCYLFGENTYLSIADQNGKPDASEDFVYFKSIIWSIVKLNSYTLNNSLLNLLIFMVGIEAF